MGIWINISHNLFHVKAVASSGAKIENLWVGVEFINNDY